MLSALKASDLPQHLIYTHPAGGFNLLITLGIYIGVVLASPVVLYQIWLFVAPALYKHERGAISGFLFSTVFLFLAGIAFGYFVTLPYMLRFLVKFTVVSLPGIEPMITVTEYFDLTLMVLLGFGLVFELPVLIFFLTDLWNRNAAISLEEHSLRDSGDRHCGRDHHAHARRHDHAHLYGSDGRTLFHRHCGFCGSGRERKNRQLAAEAAGKA